MTPAELPELLAQAIREVDAGKVVVLDVRINPEADPSEA
jgi:hypothetical protein